MSAFDIRPISTILLVICHLRLEQIEVTPSARYWILWRAKRKETAEAQNSSMRLSQLSL